MLITSSKLLVPSLETIYFRLGFVYVNATDHIAWITTKIELANAERRSLNCVHLVIFSQYPIYQSIAYRAFLLATWIFITTFVFLTLLLALALYLLARQRKKEEQELRLVIGRQQLIGQEIDKYLEELESLDQNEITALRQNAETALDQIHIALVERQVHLLNHENLTHLHKCKMNLLAELTPPLQAPAEDRSDLLPPTTPTPSAPHNQAKTRDRSVLEGELRDRINQLQDRKKTKK